jgi:hypothetical protein
LFVCGHCKKAMVGRTETDWTTRKKTVVYVCSTYVRGRCGGHEVPCGYHRITHGDAERMLLGKVEELGLEFDRAACDGAKANIKERLARLGHEDQRAVDRWEEWVDEGIKAFVRYLADVHGLRDYALGDVSHLGINHYACGEDNGDVRLDAVAAGLTDLRAAITAAEQAAVDKARGRLAALKQEHKTLTLAWAKASDQQQAVLKEEIEWLEGEVREWEPRTVPLTSRLKELFAAEAERQGERQRLLTEWPSLDSREKGESLRRLFKTVTLYWDRTFHPASERPTRPRKTDRAGRFSYRLDLGRTEWAFAASDLGGSW